MQSQPPFLVVHTNAAYSRLTGIDSHRVVGKPVRELLSVGESLNQVEPGAGPVTDERDGQDNTSSVSGSSNDGTDRKRKFLRLERLIASSGLGRKHILHVHGSSHHLIGTNVTIYHGGAIVNGSVGRNKDQMEIGADDPRPTIRCSTSIAPIVSTEIADESEFAYDAQKLKRRRRIPEQDTTPDRNAPESPLRKQHHLHGSTRITHFVIQLCAADDKPPEAENSLSSGSTSVQARLLGLSKENFHAQRMVVNQENPSKEVDEETIENRSESTDHSKEPLTAIG